MPGVAAAHMRIGWAVTGMRIVVRHCGTGAMGIGFVHAMPASGPGRRFDAAQFAAKEKHDGRSERRQQRNEPNMIEEEHFPISQFSVISSQFP
jgi:hypothetical protein